MGDQLTDLLRERFTGHEMSVPPGAWEHVSGQLAANASGQGLRESLQDKFHGHEMQVDPSAWANISGQLGHGAAAGSAYSAGWIAAGVAAVAVTVSVLLWTNGRTDPKAIVPEKVPVGIAATSAPETPAATFPTTLQPENVQPERLKPQEPLQAAPLVTRKKEEPPVTTAAVPEPKPNKVEVPVPALRVATTPSQEPKPAEETKASTSEKPEPQTATDKNLGTATPEARPNDEPAGASSTGTDPEGDQPNDDPFQTAVTNGILIPNVFSPQGDGVNDKLKIVASDYEKADVRVFAAKGGALIFRSNDLSNMWDGRMPNGNIAEEGYYKCVVLLTDADGRPRVKSEVVRLFR